MADLLLIPIVIFLLALSGFFSGSETALTAASRARMLALQKDGHTTAGRVMTLRDQPEKLIGAILLGNNVVNILATLLAGRAIAALFPGALGVLLATVVMTLLVLVFAEVLPKTYAIANADRMAMAVSGPIAMVTRILSPLVLSVQFVVGATLKLVGVKAFDNPLSPHDEIRGAIDLHHQEGAVDQSDRQMLGGILDLRDLTVGDVMVHRTSMEMIDVSQPVPAIITQALDSRYTRIPLWQGDAENIVGVLHAKDVSRAIGSAHGDLSRVTLQELSREAWFVPETTSLFEQLNAFRAKREHFALVVDEYGALMGLVTLEDILEEIVGEIEDEHDEPLEGVEKHADGSLTVAGAVTIRDLNREMGWDLPDDEAVTVAGLVIHEAQTIPEIGQTFAFYERRFEILDRERNQITRLRVRMIPVPQAP